MLCRLAPVLQLNGQRFDVLIDNDANIEPQPEEKTLRDVKTNPPDCPQAGKTIDVGRLTQVVADARRAWDERDLIHHRLIREGQT